MGDGERVAREGGAEEQEGVGEGYGRERVRKL